MSRNQSPGQGAIPYPNDAVIKSSAEIPSAPYFALLVFRGGDDNAVQIAALSKNQLSLMLGHRRLNQWFKIVILQVKPTLHPKKHYTLTSVGALKARYQELPEQAPARKSS